MWQRTNWLQTDLNGENLSVPMYRQLGGGKGVDDVGGFPDSRRSLIVDWLGVKLNEAVELVRDGEPAHISAAGWMS